MGYPSLLYGSSDGGDEGPPVQGSAVACKNNGRTMFISERRRSDASRMVLASQTEKTEDEMIMDLNCEEDKSAENQGSMHLELAKYEHKEWAL